MSRIQGCEIAEFHGKRTGRAADCFGKLYNLRVPFVEGSEWKAAVQVHRYKELSLTPAVACHANSNLDRCAPGNPEIANLFANPKLLETRQTGFP